MKNDLWKYTVGISLGVAGWAVVTQMLWFFAFEKDAATRFELEDAGNRLAAAFERADATILSSCNSQVLELNRILTEVRNEHITLQANFRSFQTESTADRASISAQLKMIYDQLIGSKAKPSAALVWPESVWLDWYGWEDSGSLQ